MSPVVSYEWTLTLHSRLMEVSHEKRAVNHCGQVHPKTCAKCQSQSVQHTFHDQHKLSLAKDKQTTLRLRRKSSNDKTRHRWRGFPTRRPEQNASGDPSERTHIGTRLERNLTLLQLWEKKLLENIIRAGILTTKYTYPKRAWKAKFKIKCHTFSVYILEFIILHL